MPATQDAGQFKPSRQLMLAGTTNKVNLSPPDTLCLAGKTKKVNLSPSQHHFAWQWQPTGATACQYQLTLTETVSKQASCSCGELSSV